MRRWNWWEFVVIGAGFALLITIIVSGLTTATRNDSYRDGVCVVLRDGTQNYYPETNGFSTEDGFLKIYKAQVALRVKVVYSTSAVKIAHYGPCEEEQP